MALVIGASWKGNSRADPWKPLPDRAGKSDLLFAHQHGDFPRGDWREPTVVVFLREFGSGPLSQLAGVAQRPQQDMGVEQEIQSRRASHSCGSTTGPMMSPRISMVPAKDPIQSPGRLLGGGGLICATGFPKRVRSTGWPVFRTFSITARQVALNFETAISSTPVSYYGPTTMV